MVMLKPKEGESMALPSSMQADRFKGLRTLDAQGLVDIRSVTVDRSMPIRDRLTKYITDIGDPYAFRVGDTAVRVKFNNGAQSLQERLIHLVSQS